MVKKTRAAIAAEIAAELADNTTGDITPAKLRAVAQNQADSAAWHDEVVPFCDQYLEGSEAIGTDVTPAIERAIAASVRRLRFRTGSTYIIGTDLYLTNEGPFLFDIEPGAVIKRAANVRFEIGDGCEGIGFLGYGGGIIDGNHTAEGHYDSLIVSEGITSGNTAGTANATYSAGTSSIQIDGLGTGWIIKGSRIEIVGSDRAVDGYIVTADAEITAGSATVSLSRGVDEELASGDTVYVKQYGNRLLLDGAASAGATTITVRGAEVTSGTTAEMKDGDQFCFHTDDNAIGSIDFSEIYTVVGGVAFSGTYPDMSATITITPALSTSKVDGQMVTSIQDHRNNKHTTLLFYGTENCFVDGVVFRDCPLHAVMANASIRAPWRDADPSTRPNKGFRISNCRDESTEPGTCFGGAYAEDVRIEGCRSDVATTVRNGVQTEQCRKVDVSGCFFTGKKTGIMFTGENRQAAAEGNHLENCTVGIDVRQITRGSIVIGNTIDLGTSGTYGIRAQAGLEVETEETFNTFAAISNNLIMGGGNRAAGTYAGSHIIIQPTRAELTFADPLRPHYLIAANNISYGAGRHGIAALMPAYVQITGNTIYRPGECGLWAHSGEDLKVFGNRVADAGQEVGSAAFYFEDVERLFFNLNHADVVILPVSDSPQTYGAEFAGATSVHSFLQNDLKGVTLDINDTSYCDSVMLGAYAGRAYDFPLDARNTGLGATALRQVTTGIRNTAVGFDAGGTIQTGNRNTFIGYDADAAGAAISNGIAIGNQATIQQNNELALGSSGTPLLNQTTVGAAGAADALPANPTGYLYVNLNGTGVVIPYFAAS